MSVYAPTSPSQYLKLGTFRYYALGGGDLWDLQGVFPKDS